MSTPTPVLTAAVPAAQTLRDSVFAQNDRPLPNGLEAPSKNVVTISAIAKAAGVAKSTASMALRGDLRISKARVEAIRQLATQMGYRPNPHVSWLMHELRNSRKQKHMATLALVNCSPETTDPQAGVAFEVRQWAQQLGYSVDSFALSNTSATPARTSRILFTRGIHGVIYVGVKDPWTIVRQDPEGWIWRNYPAIVIGTRPVSPALPFAMNDHFATAFDLGRRLSDLGYTRIGAVMDSGANAVGESRYLAGLQAFESEDFTVVPPLFASGIGTDRFEAQLKRWLQQKRPQAILCLSPGIPDAIRALGLRIPEDVGVAFLDLDRAPSGAAGMQPQARVMAQAAVDALVARIHQHDSVTLHHQQGIIVGGVWKDGDTVCSQAESSERPRVEAWKRQIAA